MVVFPYVFFSVPTGTPEKRCRPAAPPAAAGGPFRSEWGGSPELSEGTDREIIKKQALSEAAWAFVPHRGGAAQGKCRV